MPTEPFTTPEFPELLLRPAQLAEPAEQAAIDQLYHACRQDLQALPLAALAIDSLIKQQQQIQAYGLAQQYPAAQSMVLVAPGQTTWGQVLARIIFDYGQNDLRLIDIMVHPMIQRRGLARPIVTVSSTTGHAARCAVTFGGNEGQPEGDCPVSFLRLSGLQ